MKIEQRKRKPTQTDVELGEKNEQKRMKRNRSRLMHVCGCYLVGNLLYVCTLNA